MSEVEKRLNQLGDTIRPQLGDTIRPFGERAVANAIGTPEEGEVTHLRILGNVTHLTITGRVVHLHIGKELPPNG